MTLSRSTSLATSASPSGFIHQAVLRRAQWLAPAGGQCEAVEAELGIEGRRLVAEQAHQVLGVAGRNGGGDAGAGDAAIDPVAGQMQPPRAELPVLQLPRKIGHQPIERLRRGFGMGRRLGQPGASRAAADQWALAVSGSSLTPQRPVERMQRIIRLAEAPLQALARQTAPIARWS